MNLTFLICKMGSVQWGSSKVKIHYVMCLNTVMELTTAVSTRAPGSYRACDSWYIYDSSLDVSPGIGLVLVLRVAHLQVCSPLFDFPSVIYNWQCSEWLAVLKGSV